MRERVNFWVIGGDPRQATLARALNEDDHAVHTYALERGGDATLCADSLSGGGHGHADWLLYPRGV